MVNRNSSSYTHGKFRKINAWEEEQRDNTLSEEIQLEELHVTSY